MIGHLIGRFYRDDSGAFAVIFGMIAIVLVAMAGATVDLVRVDQMRNRAQIALDSAALALQPAIYDTNKTEAELKDYLKRTALELVEERMTDTDAEISMSDDDVSFDTANGSLHFKVTMKVPMYFVSLVGVNDLTSSLISQVTRKKLNIEVAMVLDNSGSMAGTKMSNLKTAAQNATCILFYGKGASYDSDAKKCKPDSASKDEHTKIGIIPFTFFVNVGSAYANASWVDRTGNSISRDNFDDNDNHTDAFTAPFDRIDLMSDMTGQSWKGCFESRLPPYDVNDATPDPYDPDTMFTPEFAPDEPDSSGYGNSYLSDFGGECPSMPTWVYTQVRKHCNHNVGYWNQEGNYNSAYCSGGTTNTYVMTYADGTTSTSVTSAPASVGASTDPNTSTTYSSVSVGWYTYDNTRVITYKYNLPERERQERICKYKNAIPSYYGWTKGPNAGCPDADLQPLTDSPSSIIAEIDDMKAEGGTNIHEGAAWGFRVLSPTEPFTEARPYGNATSKVLIIMTDGENTYYPYNNQNGTEYYMTYGYAWNNLAHLPDGRLGTHDYESKSTQEANMNTKTKDTCENAKKAGITIYTIGLQSPNDTTTNMLKDCASETSMAYFPTDPSQLNDVFASIAAQLAQLRIEK